MLDIVLQTLGLVFLALWSATPTSATGSEEASMIFDYSLGGLAAPLTGKSAAEPS